MAISWLRAGGKSAPAQGRGTGTGENGAGQEARGRPEAGSAGRKGHVGKGGLWEKGRLVAGGVQGGAASLGAGPPQGPGVWARRPVAFLLTSCPGGWPPQPNDSEQ